MYDGGAIWSAVDMYFIDHLVAEDEVLVAARQSSARTSMPHADVSSTQGGFLAVIARIVGARRVLGSGR